MTTTATSPGLSKDGGTDKRLRPLLGVVLAAQFMALLDTFIVNVAAPTIRTGLGASGAALQLVVAGYTITYAVLLITGARLGDLLGHRRAYLGGLALFTASSLACGLAGSAGQLIAFRLAQGAGAALLIPQVLSLIQRHFTGEGRVRALGAYSAVLATGAAAGQVVGGVLVSADLLGTGWRPVFLVNVPIGLVLLVLGVRVLPRDRHDAPAHARGLDLVGLVLLAAAVSLLTVPLVLGQEQGWPAWCWASLALSAVVFAAFRAYEAGLARRGGAPLIAPRVLRIPGMGLAVVRIAVAMGVNAGFLFAMTLHFQGGLAYGALRAGLTFAPTAVVFGVVGLTWRRWPAALRRALVPGGFLISAASALASGWALRDGHSGGPLMYGAFIALGGGLALAFSPVLTGALATVRQEDAADASGLLATVTQLGQLLGVATFGTLFLSRLTAPGSQVSADALWVCALALAVASIMGASAGLVRRPR
ncbi:MFS transporter [Streptomyces sp. WAC05374]|uniref:MFS transporter n=1 Tax=Streptomyces sp. WAC05374 TaxID=2487420 RepID=UPI000F86AF07|nr:MFS transporter [Streptomyces sp. WAC05374]RST08077.1 MFS transporter [Streptomyces sp. WAC05374]TDF45333.1 MFS transporter [Streptomyces sp. WAC05374]TDF55679.1 MFS transporter [Streptomyces sp. WAC05374]TDF58816.1 MFS transporter [Streptomyces sp. WAC05374]